MPALEEVEAVLLARALLVPRTAQVELAAGHGNLHHLTIIRRTSEPAPGLELKKNGKGR